MALTRPSQALSNKTNVNPSVNRQQEATAADFNEIGGLFNEYATAIETLEVSQSQNPYYGRWDSLALLQQAFPAGEVNAFALIDPGAGVTPQVAAWDDTENLWEVSGASDKFVFVNSAAQLPAQGQEQIDYITLNDMKVRVWHNNAYLIKSPQIENLGNITALQPFFTYKHPTLNTTYIGLDTSGETSNTEERYLTEQEMLDEQSAQTRDLTYFVWENGNWKVYRLDVSVPEDGLADYTEIASFAANGYIEKNRLRTVIDIVDNTQSPQSETEGDRFILDFTPGGVHADWDGANTGDVIEFKSGTWESYTPSEGDIVYVDNKNNDYRFVDDGTPAWEVVSGSSGAETVTDQLPHINIDKVSSKNGFQITVPTSDGSGEATHPCVIYDDDGIFGFKSVMVHTPYPDFNDQLENPEIVVSNEPPSPSQSWSKPSGLVNPIVPSPSGATNYNSDPCLHFEKEANTLYSVYRETILDPSFTDNIRVLSTTGNITSWTSPTTIFSSTTHILASPILFKDDSLYRCYYVKMDTTAGLPNRVIVRRESSQITTGWSGETSITLNGALPSGKDLWHLDIQKLNGQYVMFLNLSTAGTSGEGGVMVLAVSNDGLTFNITNTIINTGSGSWDNASVYRGSAVKLKDQFKFGFYYSGYDNAIIANATWGIGYTEINLSDDTKENDTIVKTFGTQTINDVKTFGSFPVTPSAAPTQDYEVANRKFVLDNAGGVSEGSERIPMSDENSVLVVANDVYRGYRFPFSARITNVISNIATASTSGNVVPNIAFGDSSIFITTPRIDANTKTSAESVVPNIIGYGRIPENAELKFNINSSGTNAEALKLNIIYEKDDTIIKLPNSFKLNQSSNFGTVNPYGISVNKQTFTVDGVDYEAGRILWVLYSGVIKQFHLSTANDITTRVDSGKSLAVSPTFGASGLDISDDGTQVLITSWNPDRVTQHTLSTAGDISTGGAESIFAIAGNPYHAIWHPDGNSFYALINSTGVFVRYSMSTQYDITTATITFDDTNLSSNTPNPRAVRWVDGGSKLLALSFSNNKIYMYRVINNISTNAYNANGLIFIGEGMSIAASAGSFDVNVSENTIFTVEIGSELIQKYD